MYRKDRLMDQAEEEARFLSETTDEAQAVRRGVEAMWRVLESDAVRRAVSAFVEATNTAERYHRDAEFHARVDMLAHSFLAGVFDWSPLTERESTERIEALGRVTDEAVRRFMGEAP